MRLGLLMVLIFEQERRGVLKLSDKYYLFFDYFSDYIKISYNDNEVLKVI